jgi:hypothetical protein
MLTVARVDRLTLFCAAHAGILVEVDLADDDFAPRQRVG